jgi:Pyridoxamine 5'-phosphate oxidase
MQDHIPQDACRILGAARTVHVAVHAARGPHVTPQAYLWTGDSLWLVTSRTSLKARVLRRRPQVGLLVRDGDESVILRGTAHVLWPTNIGSAVQAGLALPVVPLAGAAYAARNAPLLAGYASELLGRGAPVPYDRIFIRVQIDRGAVVCGDATVERWGDWSIPVGSAESPLAVAVGALPDGIPQEILAMIARARDAVLTCSTTSGLLPLPATWDGRAGFRHRHGSHVRLGPADRDSRLRFRGDKVTAQRQLLSTESNRAAAAVGVALHSAWAMAVMLAGRPGAPLLVDRRRIVLAGVGLPPRPITRRPNRAFPSPRPRRSSSGAGPPPASAHSKVWPKPWLRPSWQAICYPHAPYRLTSQGAPGPRGRPASPSAARYGRRPTRSRRCRGSGLGPRSGLVLRVTQGERGSGHGRRHRHLGPYRRPAVGR